MSINSNKPVVFISRTMPHYRLPVMEEINKKLNGTMVLIYSEKPIPGEKNNEVFYSENIPTILLHYRQINVLKEYQSGYFVGLIKSLFQLRPGVVIVEGESNLINNAIVFLYHVISKTPYLWWGCGRVRNRPVSMVRIVLHPLLRILIGQSWGILGYSAYACSYYSETYKIPRERTFCVCNSLHKQTVEKGIRKAGGGAREKIRKTLNVGLDDPVLLYVGALVHEKKPIFTIHVHKLLQKKMPRIQTVIVGGGDAKEDVVAEARGIQGVHIIGKVVEGVEAYFLSSDIYLMPGLGGLGLQQAMLCGMPAIVSIADGTEIDLVKDGKNGFVLELGAGTEIWCEKIEYILGSRDRLREMGKESLRIVQEEFNSEIMVERICLAVNSAATSG